ELHYNKLVERHVVVERLDDPIAIEMGQALELGPRLGDIAKAPQIKPGEPPKPHPKGGETHNQSPNPAIDACRVALAESQALTNSSTSSGLGGIPTTSKYKRRINVRGDAAGDGVSPC